jgi:arylsulfatase A-like enzyme
MNLLDTFSTVALSSLYISLLATAYLLFSSLKHHTRTGPRVKETIELYYKTYAAFAMLRLCFWSTVIVYAISFLGSLLFVALLLLFSCSLSLTTSLAAGALSTLLVTSYLFCHHLLFTPSLILVSTQIRFSRLDPLWRLLDPKRLRIVRYSAYSLIATVILLLHIAPSAVENIGFIATVDALIFTVSAFFYWFFRMPASSPTSQRDKDSTAKPQGDTSTQPNIVMIGTDTLRADRLGKAGYHRQLTPTIDQLAKRSFTFNNCYVPLARTAPSLTSLLTGCWPHNHKIRSNYPANSELKLPMPSLVKILADAGYNTGAIGDWAAADLGKIDFGFQHTQVPGDQWNLKYLIKQGSAFIRLFLSLFSHNRFGQYFLPEVYYLAGVPLSEQTGSECRNLISAYAADEKPFFINYFSAATHVPFGSNYPYYSMFTEAGYEGESRFLMTSLASPEEIIEKQGLSTEDFDVPQILNLYDGCVRQFDDEVDKIANHIEKCGLGSNTIIVIYSDHGADFFENGCWGQGNTLLGNDPSNRIPLVLFDPRREGGKSFSETIRSIDIAPTLLDLIGLTPPPVDGESFTPWLDDPRLANDRFSYQETGVWLGKMPGMREDHLTYPDLLEIMDIPDKYLATLTLKHEYYPLIIQAKDRAIRDGCWKLIYQPTTNGPDYLLFDMRNDPQCQVNVSTEHPEIFIRYKNLLDEWIYSDPLMAERH